MHLLTAHLLLMISAHISPLFTTQIQLLVFQLVSSAGHVGTNTHLHLSPLTFKAMGTWTGFWATWSSWRYPCSL